MHTPEKVKFWQSRGQRFDPANLELSIPVTLPDAYLHLRSYRAPILESLEKCHGYSALPETV